MPARRNRTDEPPPPALVDRLIASGCRRIAVVGLHARSGSRTVVETLVRGLRARDLPAAVTSFPRPPLDDEPPEPVTRLELPAETVLASAVGVPEGTSAALRLIEESGLETSLGPIGFYRVVEPGTLELHGPVRAGDLARALPRLADLSGGVALVDGSWGHREFAAPEVTDGVILAMGAGFSETPERAAAAARYVLECMEIPACSDAARAAWRSAAESGTVLLLDAGGGTIGALPPALKDPLPALESAGTGTIAQIVLPRRLRDAFLAPLVRSELRCTLVVGDPTRIDVAPVYLKAWQKSGGRIEAVATANVLAVAVNPVNPFGADADPEAFRRLVARAIPGRPVHDVVRETAPARRAWRFWG